MNLNIIFSPIFSFFFRIQTVHSVNGSVFTISRVDRLNMGAYLCIASNGIPPSVSKRVMLIVHCEYNPPEHASPTSIVTITQNIIASSSTSTTYSQCQWNGIAVVVWTAAAECSVVSIDDDDGLFSIVFDCHNYCYHLCWTGNSTTAIQISVERSEVTGWVCVLQIILLLLSEMELPISVTFIAIVDSYWGSGKAPCWCMNKVLIVRFEFLFNRTYIYRVLMRTNQQRIGFFSSAIARRTVLAYGLQR